MAIHIAFLEDDTFYADCICRELRDLQYDVTHFSTGQACFNSLLTQPFDICLFDSNLPDISGPDIMQRLRAIGPCPPIIFLTGRDSEEDITQILLAGADDYIIKPPAMAVLHARIQAVHRRGATHIRTLLKENLGALTIDHQHRTIFLHGHPVLLTGAESTLAFHFFTHQGQLISRAHLNHLLNINDALIDTRRLDVHISHLRKKLALNAMHGWRLTSIYQQGYRLEYLLNHEEGAP